MPAKPEPVILARLALDSLERDRVTHPPGGHRCPNCSRRVRSLQGLAMHRTALHPPEHRDGPQNGP